MDQHLAKLALFFCGLLAVAVARRAPQHRPIAIALLAALALDAARAVLPLPARWALAVYIAGFGIHTWAALRAFRATTRLPLLVFPLLALGVLLLPRPRSWWPVALLLPLALSALIQIWGAARFYIAMGPSGITQRVALVLLGGDVAGLVFGHGLLVVQAGLVAIFVAALQVVWLSGGGAAGRRDGGLIWD